MLVARRLYSATVHNRIFMREVNVGSGGNTSQLELRRRSISAAGKHAFDQSAQNERIRSKKRADSAIRKSSVFFFLPSSSSSLSSSSSFRHLYLHGLFFSSFFFLLVYRPDINVTADLAPKNNKIIPFPLFDYLLFVSFSASCKVLRFVFHDNGPFDLCGDSWRARSLVNEIIRQATDVLEGWGHFVAKHQIPFS